MSFENERKFLTTMKRSYVTTRHGRALYRHIVDVGGRENVCYETHGHKSPEATASDCIDKAIEIESGKIQGLKNPDLITRFLYRKAQAMERFVA